MPAFHPAFDALPSEIPIFPLGGALLLPGGRLPLNIFEPRYLAMTEDALAAGRFLGMVQPDPGLPRTELGSQTYRIGCLGRISSFAETEDGRYLISLTGVIRYRILEEVELRRGYRRARVEYGDYGPDLVQEGPPPSIDRAGLLGALRPYFRARGIEANWEAVENTGDAMLVTTLSMLCPFEVREKQALLEAASVEDRAAMLVALMQMDSHGMAPEGRPS
ncbi:LON peptidase substrate-binding domain-containing protein [Falsiroseomonas tokyonensis]|uniref:LON peptidase substrate-binding domain-containing protein n=1 Tax=Falsiroseomonas tokyonensis TaxID=430521 RepID=A0ABV7BX53_9PROT|nr:LON peptidase substrate-binding domain-containing protein [Falsiroseomonas tokyonensis]MBU8539455.1 LON peptidase substrate-binding domain-containing protein [Falsiroseomonas tokyonensis]